MIEITDLSVRYGAAEVFRDVGLELGTGRIVALLGNNGAGKTTLLRALSGTLALHGGRIAAGRVRSGDVDLDRLGADAIVRRGIVQVPEGRRVFAQLTVEENLMAGALSVRSRTQVRTTREQVHELFPILADRGSQQAGLLSGGEQQMLAIGRALMSSPDVLLMDEPSLGIAPLVARQIMATVEEINRAGTSVLLVEQNTQLALSVAHHAYLLNGGRVVLEGPADQVRDSPTLLEVSLGHDTAQRAGVPGGAS